jgi:hypothetical protein
MASSKLVTDVVEDPSWSLNLEHQIWCNPWNRRIASDASFPELFRLSLSKLSTLYYMVNEMLAPARQINASCLDNLLAELGNLSYHSGLPCTDELLS